MARRRQSVEEWKGLAETAHFNARALAQLCGLSIRQLQRDFRRQFGSSPQHWLNEQRIATARELLLSGLSVKAVAFELGFKQPSHFCRQFKLSSRLTPSEFVSMSSSEFSGCRSQVTSVAVG